MSLRVVQDTFSPLLRSLMRRVDPAGQQKILLQWGAVLRRKAQDNALAKGGRKFWRQMARSVNIREVRAGAVQVASDHVAAAQMQYGGDISAPGKHSESPAQTLTIPLTGSPAEGRRASEFRQKLFVPKGTSVLGYSEGDQFVGLFALKKRVSGPKNKWFPEAEEAGALGEDLGRKLLGAGA